MRVIFDAALDGGGWPGPLAQPGDVAYGTRWVGSLGLLDLLETRLGLGGRFDPPLERACRLIPKLGRLEGHWSASFTVDPLATSRRLLRERDELRLFGWAGQPFSPRLGQLGVATAEASAGIPDRLEAVARALAGTPPRSPGMERLVSYTHLADLPPLWRTVFGALGRAGVTIEETTLDEAASTGDLAGARRPGFRPAGDGRMSLLRRHGPLDVADELAAFLAAWDSLEGVVIVSPDGVLDAALARHGLPRLGSNGGPPASTRLLTLVLEAAFHPMAMCDLHALLAADPGPIPRATAAALIRALGHWPGRGATEWKQALAAASAALALDASPAEPGAEIEADTNHRAAPDAQPPERHRRRAELLVSSACAGGGRLPIAELRTRLQALDGWARSRAPHVSSLAELSRQIATLRDTVDLMGADSFSSHELRRLCQEIGEAAFTWAPAEAGLASVPSPGAILAPARAVLWWDFSRARARHPRALRLTREEIAGFHSAGLEPPDPRFATGVLAAGWRRPLHQAGEALVLACPATTSGGEANYPHPLWDEITASLDDHRDARKLERRQLDFPVSARRAPIPRRSLVVGRGAIEVERPLALRDTESPSSLEKLMGCSLSWALKYHAHLGVGSSVGPTTPGPQLFGSLAHRLLAQVWELGDGSPDAAATVAGALFDQQCEELCEELGLPQHQAARATVRRAVVESARELARLAIKYGAGRPKTEFLVEAVLSGHPWSGRVDLAWEDLGVIIDLKWGKTRAKERLESGAAVQLAAYGAMWQQARDRSGVGGGGAVAIRNGENEDGNRGGGAGADGRHLTPRAHDQGSTAFPEMAYFCVHTQELLTQPGTRFGADGKVCGAHTSSDTWSGVRAAFARGREALAAGRLEAPGVADEPPQSGLSPAGLVVAPPCDFCELSALCGFRASQ